MSNQDAIEIAKQYATAINHKNHGWITSHLDELDAAKSTMSKREWWDAVNNFMEVENA